MKINFLDLEEILLNMGGESVEYTFEEDLLGLVLHGKEFFPDEISLNMEDSQCHKNTATAYQYAKEQGLEMGFAPYNYTIATGWALSEGKWYQHSWLLDINNNLAVETTPIIREQYYGIKLSEEESEMFCDLNL